MSDLVTRLRALAVRAADGTEYSPDGYWIPDLLDLSDALREAADALEARENQITEWKWNCRHACEEREALKAKLAASEHEAHLTGIVRDEAMAKLAGASALLEHAREALEWIAGVTGPSFLNDIRQRARAALEETP